MNLQIDLTEKEKEINGLKLNVTTLTSRVNDLEVHLDDVDQYERRVTVILSGTSLPPETKLENTPKIVTQTIKDQLKINIQQCDISASHCFQLRPPTIHKREPNTKTQRLVKQDIDHL